MCAANGETPQMRREISLAVEDNMRKLYSKNHANVEASRIRVDLCYPLDITI